MRVGQKRRRPADPVKGARILVLDPDPVELERLSQVARGEGCKVLSLGRPEAAPTMARVFRPELAVVGVTGGDPASLRAGRRLVRRSGEAVPALYVGDLDPRGRRQVLETGLGADLVSRRAPSWELALRLRRLLGLKAGLTRALRREYEELAPAMRDGATGLYNRPFLLEMVGAELRRAERHGGAFTVVIAELGDFVALRARHGDEVCDRLMVYGSVLLRQALREADLVARVGRYHYAALLPGLAEEEVGLVLRRLEARMGRAAVQVEGATVRLQVTLGTATFPDVPGPAHRVFAGAIQDLDRAREARGAGPRAAI